MAQRANFWENDQPIEQPPAQPGRPSSVREIVAPRPDAPPARTADQAAQDAAAAAAAQQRLPQTATGGVNFADEQGLADRYNRDPAVAVRGTGAVAERLRGYLSSLAGGGRLPPGIRQELLTELGSRGAELNRDFNRVRTDYRSRARRYNFDENAVIGQHPAIPYRQEMGLDRPENQDRGDLTFWDEPTRPIPPGGEQFQNDVEAAIRSGAFRTPEDIVAFGSARGFVIDRAQAEAAIEAMGRGIPVSVSVPTFQAAEISDARGQGGAGETVDAIGRGAAETASAGLATPAAAAMDTLFRGGSYGENLWRQQGIDDYDADNHFAARLSGQIAGGALIPTGAVTAARTAAQTAIRQGLGRTEAIAAARAAAGRRLATEGGAYGIVHGVATGEGDVSDRIANGVVEGLLSAAGGGIMGRYAPGPATRITNDAELPPLVNPETGRLNEVLESSSPAQRVEGEFRN